MPKRKPIAPKPRVYKKVKYRSTLEARWAVFFDHTSIVPAWLFEPKTFKLKTKRWSYCPDFKFKYGGYQYYLEVKPVIPTPEYLKVLDDFAEVMRLPLMLGVGNFYNGFGKKSGKRFGVSPAIYLLNGKTTQNKILDKCLPIYEYFPGSMDAVEVAKGYRFDLPQEPPKRKATKGPLQHLTKYQDEQRAKQKEKASKIDWTKWKRKK